MKNYFVNGVEYHTDSDHLTLSDILEKADFSPEKVILFPIAARNFINPTK